MSFDVVLPKGDAPEFVVAGRNGSSVLIACHGVLDHLAVAQPQGVSTKKLTKLTGGGRCVE